MRYRANHGNDKLPSIKDGENAFYLSLQGGLETTLEFIEYNPLHLSTPALPDLLVVLKKALLQFIFTKEYSSQLDEVSGEVLERQLQAFQPVGVSEELANRIAQVVRVMTKLNNRYYYCIFLYPFTLSIPLSIYRLNIEDFQASLNQILCKINETLPLDLQLHADYFKVTMKMVTLNVFDAIDTFYPHVPTSEYCKIYTESNIIRRFSEQIELYSISVRNFCRFMPSSFSNEIMNFIINIYSPNKLESIARTACSVLNLSIEDYPVVQWGSMMAKSRWLGLTLFERPAELLSFLPFLCVTEQVCLALFILETAHPVWIWRCISLLPWVTSALPSSKQPLSPHYSPPIPSTQVPPEVSRMILQTYDTLSARKDTLIQIQSLYPSELETSLSPPCFAREPHTELLFCLISQHLPLRSSSHPPPRHSSKSNSFDSKSQESLSFKHLFHPEALNSLSSSFLSISPSLIDTPERLTAFTNFYQSTNCLLGVDLEWLPNSDTDLLQICVFNSSAYLSHFSSSHPSITRSSLERALSSSDANDSPLFQCVLIDLYSLGEASKTNSLTKTALQEFFTAFFESPSSPVKIGFSLFSSDLKHINHYHERLHLSPPKKICNVIDLKEIPGLLKQLKGNLFATSSVSLLKRKEGKGGITATSLSKFSEHYMGYPLSKEFQIANWRMRPLTAAHVEYATLDSFVTVACAVLACEGAGVSLPWFVGKLIDAGQVEGERGEFFLKIYRAEQVREVHSPGSDRSEANSTKKSKKGQRAGRRDSDL